MQLLFMCCFVLRFGVGVCCRVGVSWFRIPRQTNWRNEWGWGLACCWATPLGRTCLPTQHTHPCFYPHFPPAAAFYSGSLLKGLAGSCALTLLIAPLRNRLRFRCALQAPPQACAGRRSGCVASAGPASCMLPLLTCGGASVHFRITRTSPHPSCPPVCACSNHLLVQLANLNLCGLTNSFMCKLGRMEPALGLADVWACLAATSFLAA